MVSFAPVNLRELILVWRRTSVVLDLLPLEIEVEVMVLREDALIFSLVANVLAIAALIIFHS
jgi:hypothetical protein